jgi:two-component system phosphate regulon response regulator OmpR
MKPTTLSSKCHSRVHGQSHAGTVRGPAAHTPQRHPTDAARQLDPALRLTASGGHLGYVEAPQVPGSGPADQYACVPGMRRVLHVDMDGEGAQLLAGLLTPEACVTHVGSLAEALRVLETNVFSLVVLDPALPDGDARVLLPLLAGTPLLVYSAHQPEWRDTQLLFLPKPWTSPRQLWVAVSTLLGVPASLASGD